MIYLFKVCFFNRRLTNCIFFFISMNFYADLKGTYIFKIQSLEELVERDLVLVAEFPEGIDGVAFDDIRGKMNVVDTGRCPPATHCY